MAAYGQQYGAWGVQGVQAAAAWPQQQQPAQTQWSAAQAQTGWTPQQQQQVAYQQAAYQQQAQAQQAQQMQQMQQMQQQPAQQQWQQQAQQQAAPVQGNENDVILEVSGCTHGTVGPIVRGTFRLEGENHGKPTYKRDGQVNGLDVLAYYWDERDGAGFCGWWFGPKVGGDQVWAYHTDKTAPRPPQTGWKVPYDGPVDASFVIAIKPKDSVGYGQQAQAVQQAQQNWAQAQPQNAWAQQNQQLQQQKAEEQVRLDAQRQQLEQMKAQQQMQNVQRAEEMRQKQLESLKMTQAMNQQQAQDQAMRLEMQRKNLEAQNMMRMAEQKQKMEDMKIQQQAMMQRRAADAKKKEAELEAKKLEQVAVLAIRRVMQKFRASTPDTFEQYKQELDVVIQQQIEKTGSQKDRLVTEIQQAVAATRERLEKVIELRKKEEEKKEAEMNRRRELIKKATELVGQLEQLVVKAEADSKGLAEEAEPFTGEKEMKLEEIEACGAAVERAGKDAASAAQACSDFVLKESANMKCAPVLPGEAPPTCTADLQKLIIRTNEVKKAIAASITAAAGAKATRTKNAHAKIKYEKNLEAFNKYDFDKDGLLSRREIGKFAKGEYSFIIPAETLDTICKVFIKGGKKGLPKESLPKAKILIGIAREAELDAKKKAAKEAKEKELAEKKDKLQVDLKEVTDLISKVNEEVTKTEKQVAPLAALKMKVSAAEMVTQATEADGLVAACTKSVAAVKETIAALNVGTDEDMKQLLAIEVKKLELMIKASEVRVAKCATTAEKLRVDAAKKATEEVETLRKTSLNIIAYHQSQKKLSKDDLFNAFDKNKDGKIEESEFIKFFQTCEKKEDEDEWNLSEDDLSKLFTYMDGDDEGFITKEQFCTITRKFMKVARASVISEDISIKSRAIRRLEEGEVLEVILGPVMEGTVEVTRMHVKCVKDDLDGWVTPLGNQGTVFLEEGGNQFKVVKETILTSQFTIGEGTADKTKDRKLKVGEICEVREWEKKEPGLGVMRMKVFVKSDSAVGWVTSVGNTGIKFLESV